MRGWIRCSQGYAKHMKTKLNFIQTCLLCSLLFACLHQAPAAVLVQDDFNGSAGATPDAANFEWGGTATQDGAGNLDINTYLTHFSWLRSQSGVAPGAGDTLILQMRAYAYAE